MAVFETKLREYDCTEIEEFLLPIINPRRIAIEGVFQNGETIAIKFGDGDVVTSSPMDGDKFDAHTGVAMCLAKKLLGSRAEFQRLVDSIRVQS